MDGSGYPPIGDYAVIGDCRAAALISRSGGLDWLCLPRFDSPSVFAALLDRERGGSFRIAPAGAFRSERRYIGETNVLETTFHTDGGVLRLVDLMPVASEAEKRRELVPDHEIVRQVECLVGEVDVEVVCDARPDFGRTIPVWRESQLGAWCEFRSGILLVRGETPLASDGRPGVRARLQLRAGERRSFSLVYEATEPLVIPELGLAVDRRVERSLRWWEGWAAKCSYRGAYRDAVVRSALALKLLTYAPSGAIVAAPTTSLPERLGGVRNWDYRYCWLRDAALMLRSFFDIGYFEEGEAFLHWLLHATRMTQPELQILYDVFGETRIAERELEHLEGYACSRPVRVGNAALQQLQLDVYGKVVDASYMFVLRGGKLDRATSRMLRGLGETVCRRWREPDEGIWEIRAGARHHTVSRAMCWVALDRLIRLHGRGHVNVDVERFTRERDAIRAEVESRGYNVEMDSYVDVLDGDRVDAALLLLPLFGYAPADSTRTRATFDRIRERLSVGPLLYRYAGDDGLPPGEGAFGICSFWAVAYLAAAGRLEEAESVFEALLRYANDVGLFAEEVDPETGRALGNFPQAFTHSGLISAALTIAEGREHMPPAEAGARRRGPGAPV